MEKQPVIYCSIMRNLLNNPDKPVTLLGSRKMIDITEGNYHDLIFHLTDLPLKFLGNIAPLMIPFVPVNHERKKDLNNIGGLNIYSSPDETSRGPIDVLEFYEKNPYYHFFAGIIDYSKISPVKTIDDLEMNNFGMYHVEAIGRGKVQIATIPYLGLDDSVIPEEQPAFHNQIKGKIADLDSKLADIRKRVPSA